MVNQVRTDTDCPFENTREGVSPDKNQVKKERQISFVGFMQSTYMLTYEWKESFERILQEWIKNGETVNIKEYK